MSRAPSPITSEDIYALLKEVNVNLSDKISKVEEEVKTIKVAVQLEIGEIKQKVTTLEKENKELKNKIEEIERKLRHNNIVIYGLKENPTENQTELAEEFLELVNTTLMVSLCMSDLNNIFRLGKNKNQSRPLLVSLVSHIKKTEILRNSAKLKGKQIFITEDLTEKGLQDRKVLIAGLKQAKADNKSVKIKGNRLVIEGKTYTAEQIQLKGTLEAGECYFSPPPEREAFSEPPTPSEKEIDLEEEISTIKLLELSKQHPSLKQQLLEEGKEKKRKEVKLQNLHKIETSIGTPKRLTAATRAQSKIRKK